MSRHVQYFLILAFAISLSLFFSHFLSGLFKKPELSTTLLESRLSEPRAMHSAILLPDSRLLIIGGLTKRKEDWFINRNIEAYNPVTQKFSIIGKLNFKNTTDYESIISGEGIGQTFTLLKNGKILIAGGMEGSEQISRKRNYDFSGKSLKNTTSNAEIFDPQQGKITILHAMTVPRWGHSATVLNDGRVLIVGGRFKSYQFGNSDINREHTHQSAELFDPKTGTFAKTSAMHIPRANHKAILMGNGKVIIIGGEEGKDGFYKAKRFAEVYDPLTEKFSKIELPERIATFMGIRLSEGNPLFFVPCQPNRETDYVPTRFDYQTNQFIALGKALKCEGINYIPGETMTQLSGDKIILSGGGYSDGFERFHTFNTITLFAPLTGQYKALGKMREKREEHTATLMKNGDILIVGGINSEDGGYLDSAEIYSASSKEPD